MDAIACGVSARFEESTGYSRKITDATVNVARTLGVPEKEIQKWSSRRIARITGEAERLQEIKSLLEKHYGSSLGITV
jgi:hypothetical protein